MDFEFILKVAERRIKAALGKAEAGKVLFTLAAVNICPERETKVENREREQDNDMHHHSL